MTEVERILAERPEFSADFLKEETRCEFFCDTRRKKIWLVLLDLAMEFDRFCREHGLTWFLVGGSMLGAARHRGFIPWDDDIDAGMPREDYEKLLSLMPEFAAPYELQAPGKTPGYFFTFARLRNVRTSALNPAFALQGFNMGLYLDIFPLDEWKPDGAEPYYNRIRDLCIDNSNYMRRSNPYLPEEGRQRAASWSGRIPWTTCAKWKHWPGSLTVPVQTSGLMRSSRLMLSATIISAGNALVRSSACLLKTLRFLFPQDTTVS